MAKPDIKTLKFYYKENDINEVDSIENLTDHNYVVLTKMTVEDKKFMKEDLKYNFEKIKFEGNGDITHISVDKDWGYVHLTGQMILENQEKVSDKMMIMLNKDNNIWLINCVQNILK